MQTGAPIFITSGRSTFNQFTNNIGAQFVGSSFDDFKNAAGIFKTPDGVFFFDPNMLNITKNAAGVFPARRSSGTAYAPRARHVRQLPTQLVQWAEVQSGGSQY